MKTPKATINLRRRVLALRFGAPVADQRIDAIENVHDRARAWARVAFEEEMAAAHDAIYAMSWGGRLWTLESIPDATDRKHATANILDSAADAERTAREALAYPHALKNRGPRDWETPEETRADLLDPFSVPGYEFQMVAKNMAPPIRSDVVRAQRDKIVEPNEYRTAFCALVNGAPDEKPESVPEKWRARFDEALESHREFEIRHYESLARVCKSPDGTFEGIPKGIRQDMFVRSILARDLQIRARCKFELALERLNRREEEAKRNAPADDETAAVSQREITTADLLNDG